MCVDDVVFDVVVYELYFYLIVWVDWCIDVLVIVDLGSGNGYLIG